MELRSTARYCATLGHKVNHSFRPNCRFSSFIHPLFGRLPSILTTETVPAGAELLVYYKYEMDNCPQWYADLWQSIGRI